jgi:nitrogen fixation-related uncharacterized protein
MLRQAGRAILVVVFVFVFVIDTDPFDDDYRSAIASLNTTTNTRKSWNMGKGMEQEPRERGAAL